MAIPAEPILLEVQSAGRRVAKGAVSVETPGLLQEDAAVGTSRMKEGGTGAPATTMDRSLRQVHLEYATERASPGTWQEPRRSS